MKRWKSAHHVDWKATAHTGDLQVREFAREQEQAVAFFLDLDVPRSQAAWFESAVDRCAFLAWNMSQRGSRVRFCTQEVDWQLPEEADVYTILKYLAIVSTRPGRPLAASHDRNVFHDRFQRVARSAFRKPAGSWAGATPACLTPERRDRAGSATSVRRSASEPN